MAQGTGVPDVQRQESNPDSIPSVTLAEAIQLATRINPAVTQSIGQIRDARAAERAAFGAYLPTLGVASSAARGNTLQGASAVSGNVALPSSTRLLGNTYSSGISSTVPLYTGGRLGADRTAAAEQRKAAEASDVAVHYNVALLTKIAYFEVLRSAELMVVAQAQVAQARQGLADAQSRLHAGTTTRSDVLRATVALSNAEDSLVTAQTEHASNQYALGRAVGHEGPVDATKISNLEPTPIALARDSLLRLSALTAPSVRSAEASARAADAGIGAAKSQYLPSLLATGGYGWLDQHLPAIPGASGWMFQVGVSYPLFTGFQREQTVTLAETQADAARSIANDTRRQARADAEQALGNVQLAANRIMLAQGAVQAAQEDLRVQESRYRAGASTFLDEVTSQLALAQAETALVNARYDYQIARAELNAIVGREL
ncbi:MAG TPA: TolC family protein [Gemmatimonadaceae bacterium]|jgi:outer membrane protein|nr:TolC family protein [Gemmatimonadaceae bacterium]